MVLYHLITTLHKYHYWLPGLKANVLSVFMFNWYNMTLGGTQSPHRCHHYHVVVGILDYIIIDLIIIRLSRHSMFYSQSP